MFKQILPQEFCLSQARQEFAAKFPQTVARCGERLENATRIAREGFVLQKNGSPFQFIVRSEHGALIWYEVDRRMRSCDCYDHTDRGNNCKHVFAVWLALRAQEIWQNTLETEAQITNMRYGRAETSLQVLEEQEVAAELEAA